MRVERVEAAELARMLADSAAAPAGGAQALPKPAPDQICLALTSGSRLEGALLLRDLAFDSAVFGAKIGRVDGAFAAHADGYEQLYSHALDVAGAEGYRKLLRRVSAEGGDEIAGLERARFSLIDVGVTLRLALPASVEGPSPQGAQLRAATDDDVARLNERCASVYRNSYLYRDPFYDHTAADELHRRWLRNCHQGGRADFVLVAVVDGVPAGYIACFFDRAANEGVIDLLAVDAEYRRRGLAAQLIRAAVGRFSSQSSAVRVATQLINYGAIALYQRLGFTLSDSSLTFTCGVP